MRGGLYLSVITFALLTGAAQAGDFSSGKKRFSLTDGQAERLEIAGSGMMEQDTATGQRVMVKRPGLAFLGSAVLPGAGQLYVGSHKRAVAFAAVEAGLWYAWWSFRKAGNEGVDEYETYADRYWDYQRYLDHDGPNEPGSHQPPDVYPEGHLLEGQPIRNSEYYENIGKYDQFWAGWTGATRENNTDPNMTLERRQYEEMRHDANTDFKRANTFASTVMFNHIIAVFDAVYSAKKANDAASMKVSLRAVPMNSGGEPVTALNLSVSW